MVICILLGTYVILSAINVINALNICRIFEMEAAAAAVILLPLCRTVGHGVPTMSRHANVCVCVCMGFLEF